MLLRDLASACLGLSLVAPLAACSSGGGGGGGGAPALSTSAAVSGPADTHCKGKPAQKTSQSVCHMTGQGGAPGVDYGPPMFGSEGDDDDCKYHVTWRSSDVAVNRDITFQVTATTKTDGKPATGADVVPELFLNDIHPAPNTAWKTTEDPPGTYTIAPVQVDEKGKWTMRFHFYEDCTDFSEESPHGHAAFYVEVP
ncbi:MAG TPA: hypothetical protein VHB21_06535 [Minicystis sp.]|nr:hypothetical protein [Minicystis sp.]